MALDIIVGLEQASQHAQDSEVTHQGGPTGNAEPGLGERAREQREEREQSRAKYGYESAKPGGER